MNKENGELTFFGNRFWSLWLMKVFRNFASMKFMLLILMYIPIVWGMFNLVPETNTPWISSTLGVSFLGGGFVTMTGARIIANTSLVNGNKDDVLNTDK